MKLSFVQVLAICWILCLASLAFPHGEGNLSRRSTMITRQQPSKILQWATDPQHAWWKRHLLEKRKATPTEPSAKPLPSFSCTCITTTCDYGCISQPGCIDIYITNPHRPVPRPIYHVCTNWALNYPAQLREQLQKEGFEILRDAVQCGWQEISDISALRVGRGTIDVNGTKEQPLGDPAEIRRVEDVLRREFPFVEILIICATLVGPVFTLLGGYVWHTWAKKEKHKRR